MVEAMEPAKEVLIAEITEAAMAEVMEVVMMLVMVLMVVMEVDTVVMVNTVLPTAKVMEDMVVNDFLHIER